MAGGTVRHVGVEATHLLQDRRGIGRYVRNLLTGMSRLRPGLRFTLYVRREADIAPLRAQLEELVPEAAAACDIATVSSLPGSDADIVWYPWNRVEPMTRRGPAVVTIHDLAPMLQLDHRWWKVLKRARHRRKYERAARRATLVLADSEFTAQEVQRILGVPRVKLRVVLLAADDTVTSSAQSSETLDRLGIAGPFFLTVGAQEGRKNLATLYRAMAMLHARGERIPLVQCGPRVAPARGTADAPWMHPAGFVSDAELAVLYRRATALVFPSRYEGFGLPVAEAMRAGGCVICADASSLPEVGGDAALLFPWPDAEALARQMTRLLHEPGLREELLRRGKAQAARFSWGKCAGETLAVFDEVVGRRPGA